MARNWRVGQCLGWLEVEVRGADRMERRALPRGTHTAASLAILAAGEVVGALNGAVPDQVAIIVNSGYRRFEVDLKKHQLEPLSAGLLLMAWLHASFDDLADLEQGGR